MAKGKSNSTYTEYLKSIKRTKPITKNEYLEETLKKYEQLAQVSTIYPTPTAITLFILDYTQQNYLYFSNTFAGHEVNEIMKGGLDFMTTLMPPAFFGTFNQQVFPAILSYLNKIPFDQQKDHIISFNNRIKSANKKNIDFIQRCTYLTSSETKLPTHCIGILLDISGYKNDERIILNLERVHPVTKVVTNLDRMYFFSN